MSFRRFIYYCMLVGAWAAFLGWALARALQPANDILQSAVYGLFLGLTVAFGLSLVDALWNFSARQFISIFLRVATAMTVGLLGSLACGGLAGTIYHYSQELPYGRTLSSISFFLSWVALGLLVGLSVCVFDLLGGLARKDVRRPVRKLIKCTLGGTFGGVLGGMLAWLLRFPVGGGLLGDPAGELFWTPTAVGFVILGGLIGLLLGLSQVVLLEAWVKVEAGFRPGRDLVLTRERIVIGRAEASDIALFGDNGVEKQHATIVHDQGGFYFEPLPNTAATYINEVPVTARALLKTGDQIRIGKSLLRFNQRRKK